MKDKPLIEKPVTQTFEWSCPRAVKMLLSFFSGADSPRSSEPIPLAVAKEAKVSDMEEDQLGEEDVIFLDNK